MFPAPEPDGAAPAPASDEPSGSSRTTLLVLGGVLGAVVVGAGAYLLLSGGSDTAVPTAMPTTASSPAPAASPSASAKPKPVVRPATAHVGTRDPFKPLFGAAVASSGSSGSSASPAPSTSVPPATPVTPTATVTLTVSKVNATTQTATVSVDGKAYAVGVGKVFATNYMVYSVFNAKCVGVLYGDQSIPVCTNAPATITP
jgi:hypothetical protein